MNLYNIYYIFINIINSSSYIKLHNKFNKGGERPVFWKLWYLTKKLKMSEKNRKICCAHWLKVSVLLKSLYYPEQPTDSKQSLSKYQWHFSQN